MSNYPPGVTGLEPQIAGYPETDETRQVQECARIGFPYPVRVSPTRVQTRDCDFGGGEVDGLTVGGLWEGGTFYWTCPVCGAENETVVEPYDGNDN